MPTEQDEDIQDKIQASMKIIKSSLTREQLMVHMSEIARRIIRNEPVEEDMLEPTVETVKLEAAKMTKLYLSLQKWEQ